ncbi:MAG: aldo/keto reductase [Melioribacteraceae bacterium]|nr:MAG: aldo/keto reductase [Melioribacteraceae bacterium]
MLSRREMIKMIGIAGLCVMAKNISLANILIEEIVKRKIPSSGELLPVIGLGTWLTFDVGSSQGEREQLKQVLLLMKEKGARVIDSSPMYGSSEMVVGDLTSESGLQNFFFYATKVWTTGRENGITQMKNSFTKMKRKQIDLMQIHNLVDWEIHLKTLYDWKERGKIKYIGITHYVDSAHDRLVEIIKSEKIDFVQVNYSIDSRSAEEKLLPTALDYGKAVLINRPFGGGNLFSRTRGKGLPEWTKEYGIESWAQFFLKFILSNSAVTCVIPGTSKPSHLIDNINAGFGKMPDNKIREKMYQEFLKL